MLSTKAFDLIKELSRGNAGNLSPYNEDCIRQVLDEVKSLYAQNQKDVSDTVAGETGLFSGVQVRHAALERNKRCLLTYLGIHRIIEFDLDGVAMGTPSGSTLVNDFVDFHEQHLFKHRYKRLEIIQEMRWEFGSVLPMDIRYNMCEQEIGWFNRYNKMLAVYMRNIGDGGLDLTQDMHPPKSLYIEVRCLKDHGEFETQDGSIIVLKRNNQHFLLRSECEHLIRQGVLAHVIT